MKALTLGRGGADGALARGGRQVLLIAPQPFFRVTGTPINIFMMCRALTESGYEVHLLTLPHGEDVAMPGLVMHRVARLPGVRDVPVGFSCAKLLYNLVLVVKAHRLLRERRFCVVHAIEESAFYAVPLARMCGARSVTDLDSDLARLLRDHGSRFGRMLAPPAARLRRLALRHSSAAIAVARHMSDIARMESPATPLFEITDIPVEGVARAPDPEAMAALRAAHGLEGRRLIVYTGNSDRRQGLDILVQAMPDVLARHPDAALLVVGGDPLALEALSSTAESLGVAQAVHLIGPRPVQTMPEYMGLADVLVSPRLEPYATPLKVFSYMASGRPIVATDLPTHTQVLDHDSAVLVPPTPAGLAAGLVAALADPAAAAARARQARHLVDTRHTYAIFKRQLAEAYGRILSDKGLADVDVAKDLGTIVHG